MDKGVNENIRVLLIDDEIPLLNALSAALKNDGLKCEMANTVAGALSILENSTSIELVISDIKMPDMDGIELLKHIRENYRDRPWLQVTFITGYATLENSVSALKLAATDFLYKPVRRQALLKSTRYALKKATIVKRELHFMTQGKTHLDRLAEELQNIKTLLHPIVVEPDREPTEKRPLNGRVKPLAKDRLLTLIQSNEIKKRLFKDDLFSDPAWNMLLDLMQHSLMGKDVAVSSLYYSSGVPIATASRRLAEMERAGLVARMPDPSDKRRHFVRISQTAYNMIEQYFRAIDDI